MHGLTLSMLDLLSIHGFSIGEIRFKLIFQIGFRNGGSFLELFKTFSVLKLENLLIISKQIVKAFFLWEIVIHYHYVLNLESLGFFVRNSPLIIFCQHLFPSIWLGSLKSNGGQPSKLLQPNPLSPLRIGLIPKSPSPKNPQSQRFQFGPNLCQTQFLCPKLRPKTLFLQTLNTRPISKGPKSKLQKPCPNLQTQMMRKKTQLPVLHSSKMKICVMGSHTLPSSNKNHNIFKCLCSREFTGLKPPRHQIFKLTIDRFEEDSWNELIQMVEDSLDLT